MKVVNNSEQQQQVPEDYPENPGLNLQNHPGSCWQTIEDPENPGLTLQNPAIIPGSGSSCWKNGSSWKTLIEDPENPGLTLQNPGLLIQDRDIDGEMADIEYEEEEDNDKSNEENTVLFNDNSSILEDSVIPLIEEDPKVLEISIGKMMKAMQFDEIFVTYKNKLN